jgi:hypothetical protein
MSISQVPTLKEKRSVKDVTRARVLFGGIELPLIPLSLRERTESRPTVEIASTHKLRDRADLPIGMHAICSQTCCIRRLHGLLVARAYRKQSPLT